MVVPRTTAVPPPADTTTPQTDYAAALQAYNRLLEMQSPLLAPAEPAPPPVEERATAFGRGLALEPLQRAYSQAVTARVFAEQYGTPEQIEAARLAEQEAMAEIQRFQEVNPSVGLFDIEGIGDVGSFAGEVLGGEAEDLAIQMGATAAGAGVGAYFGGIGAAPGAAIGRGIGVGFTTARMLPQLFAEAILAQEEAGRDPSIPRAAMTTLGNALLEFVTDYATAGLLSGGKAATSRVANAVKVGGTTAVTQGTTEALQQVIVRAQAGLPLDDEDAFREIAESFAQGLVFGAPGAVGGFISGEGTSAAQQRQLEEDQKKEAGRASADAARAITAEAPTEVTEAPFSPLLEGAIALPAPEAAPTVTEAEWKKGFRQYARERVRDLQSVSLRNLPIQEVRAIRAARQAQGITNQTQLGRNATLSEIQAVLGTEVAAREVQKQKPMTAQETAFAPIENKSFSQTQFDAVLDTVRATGKINFPEVKKVLQKTQQAPVPTQMVNDVLNEASRRGLFERTAKPRKDGGVRYTYQLSPALAVAQTEGSISQRQQADNKARFEANQREITRLQEEARRIEQTGKTLAGKARKISTPERRQIAKLERDNRSIAQRMQELTARMGLEPAVRPVPAAELTPAAQRREQTAALQTELAAQQNRAQEAAAAFDVQITALKKRLSEAQKAVARGDTQRQADLDTVRGQINELQAQREVARSAALRGETPVVPELTRYTPRFQRIANNLRGRMDRLGLKDVAVKIEGLLDSDPVVDGVRQAREGVYEYGPENRVIRLASALHDSKLTDAELEARLSEIMDHELVHALWEMGLFTEAERASLIKAAGERQYVAMIDGKPTKRKYTYLQRAQRMYADQSLEIQQEEAIAEMFRNYVAGRDKFAGRPQNIFRRIINFFKSFSKAATEEGAQGPADIFEGIQRGEVGARERAAQPEAGVRESRRVVAYDNPGGEWLANKRRQADQRMAEAGPGTASRNGITGAVTAYTPDIVTLPVEQLSRVPGAMGEMPAAGRPKFDRLMASAQAEGFRNDSPILLGINHLGNPYIVEGNNRVAVAKALGVERIPARVQWYNGGEEFATRFSPEAVQAMSGVRESRRAATADVQSAQQRLAQDPGSLGLSPSMVARINPIYRPDALPKNKMPSNREAALWLENFFEGVPITDFTATLSPDQIREIATIMAAEAELALQNSGNAFDWYSTAMANAIDIASIKYPMLSSDAAAAEAGFGTASNARFVFTYIMAVTSQNLGVRENAKATDERFALMLEKVKAGDYDMPARWGTGDKREAMGKNFEKFGPMVRAMDGDTFPEKLENLDALFRESKTVKEWEADLKAAGIPYSPPGQTAKDAVVYGSSTLGPKIGNGFWQNLNGNYTPLTIDLWMRRTWGRLTGKSIGNPDALPEQRQRFKDGVARSRSRLRGNKEEIARVNSRIEELLTRVNNLKNLDIRDPDVKAQYGTKKNITEQLKQAKSELADMLDVRPDLLGIKAPEQWQTAYNKDNAALLEYAKRSLKPWEAEYKNLRTRLTKEEIADITPTWVRAAKTIVTNLGKPLDQVANGTQRKQIEEAGRQALDILNSRGISLTNADLQAILWYPEKDLWGSLTSELNVDEDGTPIVEANPLNESYDGTFANLLEAQGYDVAGRAGRPAISGPDVGLGRPGGLEGAGRAGEEGARTAIPESPRLADAAEEDAGRINRLGEGLSQLPTESVPQVRESRRPMYSVTAPMQAASGTSNMTAIQKQVTQYTDIADWFGKALGLVVRRPGRAQEIADKFIQKTQDSFIPVARMIKELKERGLTIMDTIDPYLQQQLSRSRAGAQIDDRKRGIYRNLANAVKQVQVSPQMREGLIRISRSNATKGDGLAKYIFDRTDSDKQALAEIYLYAKHALERNQYVRQIDAANQAGSGMTDAEANAILNWFNSNLTQQNRSAIAQVEAAAQAIVADTNKVRIDGNLISPSVMNVTYNKKGVRSPDFKNYVPLRGVFDDDSTADYSGTFAGRGYNVRGREDRRILGRDTGEYGADILANLLFQNSNSIIRAEQNQVSLALADLLQSNPQATKSFGRVLARAPQQRILNAAGNVQYSTDPRYKDADDIIIAKRNGEEIIIQMEDTNLAGAFNGKNVWNAGHANVILRGLGKLNRYLSNIVTSWNPEFVITNLARDIQGAGINVSEFDLPGLRRDVVKNIPSALAGLRAAIRDENFSSQWAQRYREFAMAGGQSAANPMASLQDQIDQIESIIGDFAKGGSLQTMRRNGAKVLRFLEDYNTVVENAVRLTTFDALRKRGFSEARAAQAARSVTVDFTKTGDMGQFLNSLYLFYNAALQGSFFMFRAAARSKKVRRVLAGAIAMGVVMDMINSMVSGEDEAGIDEYDKIPDYVLEHNWIIMLPEGMAPTGRRYIAIPMPYGLNFFYNTGRAIARTGRGGYDVGQGSASITRTMLEVINPLGGTEHFLNFAAPTVADPFIQILGTNVDFTGRDIVREPFPNQQVAQSHLYWNNTSPTAVAAAQSLNALSGGTPTLSGWADISPNTLEFWFDYVTGGAGRFVQRGLELPGRIADPEQTAEDVIREVPLIRRLFGSVSSREDMGTYIRERDRILLPRAELRAAVDAGDRERIQAARERYPDELRIAEAMNQIENQRRQITRRINDVRSNPRIPEERKQEIIQRLDEQRQRVILRGLQLARSIER
jgi:hypothetical protein